MIGMYPFIMNPMRIWERLKLILKKTALLVIDMQNVFVSRPSGEHLTGKEKANWERWQPFYDKIENVVVPNNKRLLDVFRKKNRSYICQNN